MTTPTQLSHIQQGLIINGYRITGLADTDRPVQLPQIRGVEVSYGRDGIMFTRSTGMRGGDLIVTLQPTSPDAARWIREATEIRHGANISYEGSYNDPSLDYGTYLEGGVLAEAPPGIEPGKDAVFTFSFEVMDGAFDNPRFRPASAGA